MSNPIVEQLRRSIEAKHVEALRALDTLAAYLVEPITAANGLPMQSKKRSPRSGTGDIRNAVIRVFGTDYTSVPAAVQKTGLTALQIRGVVTAPALKHKFAKKEVDGVMHYKYQDNDED